MSFFDPKQEVINIELTQYGKEQFSKGVFFPTYYEFFDDDIIYDSSWGGLLEEQNSIEDRILNNSVYMKPIYNFSDRMKNNESYNFLKSQPRELINPKDPISVSTNKSVNNYIPAWDLKILNGKIDNFSSSSFTDILQINLQNLSITLSGSSLENLNISNEDLIIELEEVNCESYKENFEIELFLIDEENKDNFGNPSLKKISFGKEPIYIKDDILLDKPIMPEIEPELDPANVEYYFKVSSDKKIDTVTLKEIKQKEKNIYSTTVIEG